MHIDYEQQRRDLLRKHGIDLADGNDTRKNRRMDRKTVEEIMGPGDEGIFTWRDRNRKKVRRLSPPLDLLFLIRYSTIVSILCVSNTP